MPEKKEKPPASQDNQDAHDAIAQSLDLQRNDEDAVKVFIETLKKIGRSSDEQTSFQETFIQKWKQAYIDVGYDIDQAIKFPTFSPEKVQQLSRRLDLIVGVLGKEFDGVQADELRLTRRLQQLDKEIEQALEETDVLTVKLNNGTKTPLHIRPLSEFNPLVKPGQKIDPRSLGMAQVVYEEPILNLKTTLSIDNPDTTDIHEGIQAIGMYLIDTYFTQNKKILEKFHVTDVKHMTPKQAILVASAITMERLQYSMDQVNANTTKNVNEQEINDAVAIDELFQWERDENGNGVCRNYSAVMYGVFEALKALQDAEKSLLHNTYVLTLSSVSSDLPGAVNMHAWNGVVSLTDEGVHGMVIDTTWADSESSGNDPAQGGISSTSLDYTHGRFFTLMNKFEQSGVLPPAKFFQELHEKYILMPKTEANPITKDTLEDRIRELPPKLQMGQRMMQLLANTQKLARESENHLPDFFRAYADDLNTYLDNIKDTPNFTNEKALESIALTPFLARLNVAYEVINKQIDSGKQAWYRNLLLPVLEKYHKNFAGGNYSPYYVNVSMNLLEVAENARHKDIANQTLKEEFIPHLERNTGLSKYVRRELPQLYKGLDPERQEEYRKIASGNLQFEEEKPEYKASRLWEERIAKECGMRLTGEYHLTQNQKEKTLHTFLDAYGQIKLRHTLFDLNIEKPEDADKHTPGKVTIHEGMSQQDMVDALQAAQSLHGRWNDIRGRTACDLRVGISGIEVAKDQLDTFLNHIKSYFTGNGRQHLFRYRQIEISNHDNNKDYLNVCLNKDHFLGTFDPISIDAVLKTNDSQKHEKERRMLQTRRNLQKLEKDPVLQGINARNIETTNVYKPLKEYLESLSAEQRQFLEKHPIRLILKDAKDGLYDDAKGCIDRGYSHYLVKSLSANGAKRVLAENILATDGTVLIGNLSASSIFGSARYAQIERNGKRLPLVQRGRSIAIQIAADKYAENIEKGDKIVAPDNPIARFSSSGYDIHLFVESSPEQAKIGLEQAVSRHIEWEQQNERTKSIGISIHPSFSKSESMSEEHIARTRKIVDELGSAKLDVSDFENITMYINEDKFTINLKSKQFGTGYEMRDLSNLKALNIALSNIQRVEKKAKAIVKEGVRFSANLTDGDYKDEKEKLAFDAELAAMTLLENTIKGGMYKGYAAEIIDFRGYGWLPNPKEKKVHIDPVKKLISVHIDK